MRLTDFFNIVEDHKIEKVAASVAVKEVDENLLKTAEEYVTMGRIMARGYISEMEKIAGAASVAKQVVGAVKGYGKTVKDAAKAVVTKGADKSAPAAVKKGVNAARLAGLRTLAVPAAVAGVTAVHAVPGLRKFNPSLHKKKGK